MTDSNTHGSHVRISVMSNRNRIPGKVADMGEQWRGRGDSAFGLPRATYERTPVDEARPAPQYRPPRPLRTKQTCYVCNEVIPAGTTSARWAPSRRKWRHADCRWDLMPVT
jgi:hypothetical protein